MRFCFFSASFSAFFSARLLHCAGAEAADMGAMDMASPPKPFSLPIWAERPEAARAPMTSASCSRAAFSTTGKPPSTRPWACWTTWASSWPSTSMPALWSRRMSVPWATARTPSSSGMCPRLMRMLEKSAEKPGSNFSRRAGDMGWGAPAPDR